MKLLCPNNAFHNEFTATVPATVRGWYNKHGRRMRHWGTEIIRRRGKPLEYYCVQCRLEKRKAKAIIEN